MTDDIRPLALQMWEALAKYHDLRSKVHDTIIEIVTGLKDPHPNVWGFDDITHDNYDFSFELKNAEPILKFTKEQCLKFKELGFQRAWICYSSSNTKIIERAYSWLDKPQCSARELENKYIEEKL